MVPVSLALNWILFLAMFPIAFFWGRRAWRILVKRDFSEVALKRGMPPPQMSILNAPTRAVFGIAGEALEKALPLDLNAYRAEKNAVSLDGLPAIG